MGIGEKDITPSFFIKAEQVKNIYNFDLVNPGDDFSCMYGYMHYIGKEFTVTCHISLRGYYSVGAYSRMDFRWQEIYRFKKLVKIPKGSRIQI